MAHGLAEHMRSQAEVCVSIPEQNIRLPLACRCMDDGQAEVCRPTWTKESDEGDEDAMTCTAATCTCSTVCVQEQVQGQPFVYRVDKEENNLTWPGRGNGDKVKNSCNRAKSLKFGRGNTYAT